MFNNIPEVKLGIVAVSRDCFPIELSKKRRINVVKACADKNIDIYEAQTIVENETDMLEAIDEVNRQELTLLLYISVTWS